MEPLMQSINDAFGLVKKFQVCFLDLQVPHLDFQLSLGGLTMLLVHDVFVLIVLTLVHTCIAQGISVDAKCTQLDDGSLY